ncbi:DNA-binding protein HU-beta [invertebrate metagenome]|uniref:DNA-binding protein HU-beta n=1 Tax=invertebrate metagenome TaxID=1711999 RepID=A0A2H9T8I5_9ZZZZ
MNKNDLVAVIAEQADIPKNQAQQILDAILSSVTQTLKNNDSVNLTGFGTFLQRSRAARMGQNPKTGEKISIPASNTAAFKPGKTLKEAVNE